MNCLFTNIIGSFVIECKEGNLKITDFLLFKSIDDYQNKEKTEKKLKQKHKSVQLLPEDKLHQVLLLLKDMLSKDEKVYEDFYTKNMQLTKQSIKDSVNDDQLITQAISNISELDKTSNTLTKRLREWYSWYFPELSEAIDNHEKFALLIATKTRKELLEEINAPETMGADLAKEHVEEITLLAKQITNLYQLRKEHENYLKKAMKKYCPNLLELAGATIGAKLIELGKGLKHLAMMPASTIQLLGAEKALFRHLKTGSRSPKYGTIINHPIVQKAKRDEKGKAARMLADKLSLCARLDFFKGEFKAQEFKKELEEKFA
ncbi:MAG: NOP5/NOP56 family protein [Nanoarchaeota archaeon]